jgi:hypothetical protein
VLALYPQALDRILHDAGFEPEAIKAAWRDADALDTDKEEGRYTKRVGPRGDRDRLVVIRRVAFVRAGLVEDEAEGAAA